MNLYSALSVMSLFLCSPLINAQQTKPATSPPQTPPAALVRTRRAPSRRRIHDSGRRAEMAHKARAAAEANYRWEVQMARLDEVIAATVAQPTHMAAAWSESASPNTPVPPNT